MLQQDFQDQKKEGGGLIGGNLNPVELYDRRERVTKFVKYQKKLTHSMENGI